VGEDAIFVDEGDDIGDDAHGDEREEFDEQGAHAFGDAGLAAPCGADAPCEFVGNARAAEFAEGICAAGQAWVDECEGLGEFFACVGDIVMIGDDEIDAALSVLCEGAGWLDSGDAAVDRDDDLCAAVGEGTEGFGVDSVAFFDAMGDVGADVCGGFKAFEGVVEDAGGGDSVDVVIAVDDDLLVVAEGVDESLGAGIDAGHEAGVVEVGELGFEEGGGGGGVGEAAGGEDALDEGAVGGGAATGPAGEEAAEGRVDTQDLARTGLRHHYPCRAAWVGRAYSGDLCMSVRLTKIYTRTGDEGTTGLAGGSRVSKDSVRVHAYGEVDEANAALGLAVIEADRAGALETAALLRSIQHDMFDVGADLATPIEAGEKPGAALRIVPHQVERLEHAIDLWNARLGPLNSFVLPGGTPLAAALHLARTITRRAERAVVTLRGLQAEATNTQSLVYLNRLSDLLFVLGRNANNDGALDVLWKPGSNRS